MTFYKKVRFIFHLQVWRMRRLKRRIWNKHILLWWYRLYVRKDEFHHSLNVDLEAILEMNELERRRYFIDLAYRQKIAHERNRSG